MPILTLVIPQLKTESMKWKLEGRAVARQCQISRSLFPVLAAPSPSGQSSSLSSILSRLLFFFSPRSPCFFTLVSCPHSLPPLFVSLHLLLLVPCLFFFLLPVQLTLDLILLPAVEIPPYIFSEPSQI